MTLVKKIKLIVYYKKFKTSKLIIKNNSSPSIAPLQKTNVVYLFKCNSNKNTYIGVTTTTLSRRLTMHLTDNSSIAQHLKTHSCPKTKFRKILNDNTTNIEIQTCKQRLKILEALHIRHKNPKLNKINFDNSTNILKCL